MSPRSLVVAMCLAVTGCDAVFGSEFPVDASVDDGNSGGEAIADEELEECQPSVTLEPVVTTGSVATYFVDGNVTTDDASCGPAGMPCKTIPFALARAAGLHTDGLAGVVVNVRGGIDYSTTDPEAAITLTTLHRGLVLRAEADTGVPVIRVAGAARAGIHVCCGGTTGVSDITIAGFRIEGALEQGIFVDGNTTSVVTIRDNVIEMNGSTPSAASGGIVLTGETHGNLIANNAISHNQNTAAEEDQRAMGVFIGSSHENVVIGNVLVANHGDGIRVRGSFNRLDDNRVVNGGTSGIDVAGASNRSCNNLTVMNRDGLVIAGENNAVAHHTSSHNLSHGVAIRGGTPAHLKNVITAYSPGCGLYREMSVAEPIDHHVLYFANQGDRCGTAADDAATDVMDNPRFANHESNDYTLGADSPARGRGESGTTIGAIRSATRPR